MACYICHTTLTSYVNKENNIRLHVFPLRRPSILQQWLKFACVPEDVDPGRLVLCTKHFKKEDVIANPLRTHLVKTAVPCLHPPPKVSAAFDTLSLASDIDFGDLKDWFPEEPKEETEGQELAEKVKNQLCRVCGKPKEALQPIFDASTEQKQEGVTLAEKVKMYLPVPVERDDVLPLNICSQCCDSLNQWHELNVTCLSADTALRKVFAHHQKGCHDEQCGDNCRKIDKVVSDYFKESEETGSSSPIDEDEEMGSGKTCDGQKRKCDDEDSPETPALPQCYYCRASFECHEDHMKHFRDCRELPAMCEICGESVSHRKNLWKHKSRHFQAKVRNLRCGTCGKCVRSNPALEYHMRAAHAQQRPPKYCCELCLQPLFAKLHYDAHMRGHAAASAAATPSPLDALERDERSRLFPCPVCEEAFEDKARLALHLSARRPSRCASCGAQLPSERTLLAHRCRRWRCKFCSKTSFNNKRSLLRHQRAHTGDTPYACDACDASFGSACARARHAVAHH